MEKAVEVTNLLGLLPPALFLELGSALPLGLATAAATGL